MRVLIIGLGSIAKKHMAALQEIKADVEVFAMRSSPDSAKVDGVVDVYQLDEAKKLNVDFAIIANPTFRHKETIEDLLDLDCPLFIEKPLFGSLEGETLLHRIEQKNVVTYVACNLRFLDCLLFSKAFLAGKRINEVNIYCGSYLPDWRQNQNFRESYSANASMGGGVHLDLIHEMDYAYWIFGKPVHVQRRVSSVSSLAINAIDYANFLLGYHQYHTTIVLNYYRRDAKRTMEVICDEGTLFVDLLKNEVMWKGTILSVSTQTVGDTYKKQMSYFIDAIASGNCSLNTAHEAYEILKLCLVKE